MSDTNRRLQGMHPVDRWILSKFGETVREVERNNDQYQFDRSMQLIQDFMWHEFADHYIELAKHRAYSQDDAGARYALYTVGLGLVPGLAVIPRANQWSPEKIHRTVELAPPELPVATLPEATALIRSGDGTWRTEGVGEVVVHRGGAVVGLDALPAPSEG